MSVLKMSVPLPEGETANAFPSNLKWSVKASRALICCLWQVYLQTAASRSCTGSSPGSATTNERPGVPSVSGKPRMQEELLMSYSWSTERTEINVWGDVWWMLCSHSLAEKEQFRFHWKHNMSMMTGCKPLYFKECINCNYANLVSIKNEFHSHYSAAWW